MLIKVTCATPEPHPDIVINTEFIESVLPGEGETVVIRMWSGSLFNVKGTVSDFGPWSLEEWTEMQRMSKGPWANWRDQDAKRAKKAALGEVIYGPTKNERFSASHENQGASPSCRTQGTSR